ncbi:MAG: NupC/NupG family nucleoside CNT transporter [Ignavibacteriales bacterium]|nr:NupC/NupG family nucleoside CNT transporter [Ignavibacteriales bacterium]
MNILSFLQGLLGIGVLLGIAFLFSNNKRRINWRLVGMGLLIQASFGILVIKGEDLGSWFSPLGWPKKLFEVIAEGFVVILNFTTQGAKFVFGDLAVGPGFDGSIGFFFAFQVLPTIIFFSCLMSVLYYLGVMQKIVQGMAWIMARLMGTSGAESLSNTANVFVGQTEAPLMIRPFVGEMTNSELLTIMTGGMATIAGGVMAAYVQMLGYSFAQTHNLTIEAAQVRFAAQLLGASIMAAPASLLISKIIFPETLEPKTKGNVKIKVEKSASNVIEAAAAGASDGLQLALNVGAMLLAFIALIALFNFLLGKIGLWTGLNEYLLSQYGQSLNLQFLLGMVFQFVAFAIGVPSSEAFNFGALLGTKVVVNEFVAYLDMSKMIAENKLVSEKGIAMATFALCGFANFSSIAIQIGGISPMAPHRRKDLSALGLRAVLGGTLATLLTATIAGILIGGS